MKILVDSKLINHAWQHVMDSGPANESKAKAVEILSSILRKEDHVENDVEKTIDDLELKYLRLIERNRLLILVDIVQDIQELLTKLGLKSITDDITLEDEINEQVANNSWFNSSTSLPSDITDAERSWADIGIAEHVANKKLDEVIKAIKMPDTAWEPVDGHNLISDDLYSPSHEIWAELNKQKEAILKILNMLIDEDKATVKWSGQGTMFKTVRQAQAEELKAKLEGEK